MATNPLRLIGTDVVQPATQRIPTDVTPVAVDRRQTEENLARATELEENTRQIEQQGTQLKVEGLQALQAQNEKRLSNRQQNLGSLVQEVGGVIENLSRIEAQRDGVRLAYQKEADAEAKTRLEELDAQANIAALDSASGILLKARDTINAQGREVALPLLRRDLMGVLEDAKKKGMTSETYLEVQRYVNSELAKVEEDTEQRFYNEAREISDATASVSYSTFETTNSALFSNLSSGIASTDPAQRQVVLTQLETNFSEFLGTNVLDPAGKLNFAKSFYSRLAQAAGEGSQDYAALQLKVQNIDTGLQRIQQITDLQDQGILTPDAARIEFGRVTAQYGTAEGARGVSQLDLVNMATDQVTAETEYARAIDTRRLDRAKYEFGSQLEVGKLVAAIKRGDTTLAQMEAGGLRDQVAEALKTYDASESTLNSARARIGVDGLPGTLQGERANIQSEIQLDQAKLAALQATTTEEQRVAAEKRYGATAAELQNRIYQNTNKVEVLNSEERQLSTNLQTTVQSLTPYGLQNGFQRQQEQYNSPEAQEARAAMAQGRAAIQAEDRQGFNRGNPNAPQTPSRPLAKIDGVGFTPFEQGADVGVTSERGQRNGRHHAGLDLGVGGNKVGTPIVAVTSGTVSFAGVISGYGNTVIINDGKGHDQMYAHLNSIHVKEGQVLRQGTRVGGMGGSGTNDTGGLAQSVYVPHLHFEVRTENGNAGTDVDPVAYLAQVKPESGGGETGLGLPPTQGAPGGNSQWSASAVALPRSANTISTAVASTPPPGAFILSDGSWMVNNTLYFSSESARAQAEARRVAPSTLAYTSRPSTSAPSSNAIGGGNPADAHHGARPMRGVLAASHRADYPPKNDPAANYGYGAIAEDHQFRRKLAQISDKLGIPAQWLADVIAFETGSTFDPAKSNNHPDYNGGRGCVGMIQFCYLDGRYNEVANMTRTQQLDEIYNYFKPNAGKMNSVYDVWASVWAGLNEGYDGRGDDVAQSDISDGWITGKEYSRGLGATAGRRYAHPLDRGDSAIHSKPVSGCPTCSQMQAAKSFAAHVGQ